MRPHSTHCDTPLVINQTSSHLLLQFDWPALNRPDQQGSREGWSHSYRRTKLEGKVSALKEKLLSLSPGGTRWWLRQHSHPSLGHSSPCFPGSKREPGDWKAISILNIPAAFSLSYHPENSVRAAAALVHFCLSVVTVLYRTCKEQFSRCCSLCCKTLLSNKNKEKPWNLTFSFTYPGKSLCRRCNQFLSQVCDIDVFLQTKMDVFVHFANYKWMNNNIKVSYLDKAWIETKTYIHSLSNLEWFSLPAVHKQISHSLIINLHVGHPEKELLLRTLKEQRMDCLEWAELHRRCSCFQTRGIPYIFDSLEDVLHRHGNDSREVLAPHHGERLSRGCLPICKYRS